MQDLFILIIGIISGIIGTTMGGSMLIILPFLIGLGLPPYQAIATANFSLIGGFFSGGIKYHKNHSREIRKILYILLTVSIIGTTIGIIILTYINDYIAINTLNISVFIALLFILFITLFKNYFFRIKKIDRKIGIKGVIIFFLLSVYGGLLGIGNGIFLVFTLVNIIGLSYLNSTGIMTIISFFTTIIAVLIFYYYGAINFNIGIPFLIGITIGGFIGANIAIKKGDKLLKYLFLTITIVMIINMGYKLYY